MRRKEFSNKVRVAAFLRCKGKCEACNAVLKVGEGEYDHIVPYALSEDSTLGNCQVLCVPCHRGIGAKTAVDQKRISKAKRNYAKHNGVPAPKQPIQSPGFQKSEKAASRSPKQALPHRPLYREAAPVSSRPVNAGGE